MEGGKKSMSKFKYQDFNPYGKRISKNQLLDVRRSLAKVVNQRAVRIERTDVDYGFIDAYHAELVKRGRNRFPEARKAGESLTIAQLRREVALIQNLLNMQTSTKQGIKTIQQKREETFARLGYSENTYTNKTFYNLMSSAKVKELFQMFDSETVVSAIDQARDKKLSWKKIEKVFSDFLKEEKTHTYRQLLKDLGLKQ